MFVYELWIEQNGEPWCKHQEIAETAGKAKYQYYLYLQDGLWEAPFGTVVRHMHCHKIVLAAVRYLFGDRDKFARVCQKRGIPLAYQGMRIEVDGKMATIVGANDSSNLDVVLDGSWNAVNCHPWWRTKYFDRDGGLVYEFAG